MLKTDNEHTGEAKTAQPLPQPDGQKKRYSIKREITDQDLWVEIDTDKFMQVIDNIMNNAIKYSPDGGTITARLFQTHDHVILSISDQGLGIPRQDLSKIFDRLHGRIWVDSQEGRGSTFYISLPYEPITDGGDDWDEA